MRLNKINSKKMGISSDNRKSQITLFVIIALILVVAIAFLFIFLKPEKTSIAPNKPITINSVIENCAKQATEEYLENYFDKGILVSPDRTFKYKDQELLFLCYSSGSGEVCINEHPALGSEIVENIKTYISPRIESCFVEIKSQLKDYDYNEGEMIVNVSLTPNNIIVIINKDISYKFKGEIFSLDKFSTRIGSKLFEFVRLISEIVNEEVENCDCSESCNANLFELSNKNSDFLITKPYYASSGEEVYNIVEKLTKKELNFVIRNCAK